MKTRDLGVFRRDLSSPEGLSKGYNMRLAACRKAQRVPLQAGFRFVRLKRSFALAAWIYHEIHCVYIMPSYFSCPSEIALKPRRSSHRKHSATHPSVNSVLLHEGVTHESIICYKTSRKSLEGQAHENRGISSPKRCCLTSNRHRRATFP